MRGKDHLALSNVSLSNHRRLRDFYTSRFCLISGTPYLFWRVFWAAYHVTWLVAGPILAAIDAVHLQKYVVDDDGNGSGKVTDGAAVAAGKWFVYLSHWVYLVLSAECVMEAVLVVMAKARTQLSALETQDHKLPWVVRLIWLLSTLSLVGSVMICLWYWTMLHKGKTLTGPRVNTHGVAALYCILDLLISQKPFRLLHVPYPVLFGLTYTAFSAIYFMAGGRGRHGSASIYPVLDWASPWRTLVISSISNFLVIPLVHAALWGLRLLFESVGDWYGRGVTEDSSCGSCVHKTRCVTRKSGDFDFNVDTETSSCTGNSSLAGHSRNSRAIEDQDACNTRDSAHYLIDERSLA